MPKKCYTKKRFSKNSLEVIDIANAIINEYLADGYDLTLRQLYYQFVSRGLVANNDAEYKKLGGIIADARLAGFIDWLAIVDRTRFLRSVPHWRNPDDILETVSGCYALDNWITQEYRLEVWVEKDALLGVVAKACNELDVPYFSCRGYTSATEIWAASQRMVSHIRVTKQRPVILHLGDHDPSGQDMSRDIQKRLSMFIREEMMDIDYEYFEFRRIALNMDQVEKYKPPPNSAKLTDSRAERYIFEYGDSSWELDALDPKVLTQIIQNSILTYRDDRSYRRYSRLEKFERSYLAKLSRHWPEVYAFFEDAQG